MNKLQVRSSSYQSSRLSLAGRITLAKSVLCALPIYTMKTTVLPYSTCERLDALCRSFIWGSTREQRKIHLVGWDTVCRPKDCGGLEVRKSAWVNEAFMMKMAWGLLTSSNDFWVKIIRGKYWPHGDFPNSQGVGQKSKL